MAMCKRGFYIGLDIGTQSLKATVIDNEYQMVAEVAVHYDSDLPEFRTRGGVHADDTTVTSPPTMWVKALDMVLEKLRACSHFDFSRVISLSGSAQQHGSVYLKKGTRNMLQSLKPDKFLYEQVQPFFSVHNSPVWMDSSTTIQCRRLENVVGGAQKLANLTGSVAFERFTGSQIMKVYETQPTPYANTERISLISNFIASLFLGDFAPIDYSDGSGMNLMNVWDKDWIDELAQAVAPDLKEKLGELVPSFKNLGLIAPYFVERYGFSKDCCVVAFTGDNAATVACAMLRPGDLVVSLGTSDTLIFVTNSPTPAIEGHIMCNPTNLNSYFVMICYKNGSFVRERINGDCSEGSWQLFSELLRSTPAGNFGNIGMYFDAQEIIPHVMGEFRFNKQNQKVSTFSKEVEVRALIEGQVLSKRVHAERLGLKLQKGSKIFATGGASKNEDFLQVYADVFDRSVYKLNANSASLGAAYLAKYGCVAEPHLSFHDAMGDVREVTTVTTPSPECVKVYDQMIPRYRMLEEKIMNEVK